MGTRRACRKPPGERKRFLFFSKALQASQPIDSLMNYLLLPSNMLPDHVITAQQLSKVSWASASSSLVLISLLSQNLSALPQIPPFLSKALFACGSSDTNGNGYT